jgi:hypothetical protein
MKFMKIKTFFLPLIICSFAFQAVQGENLFLNLDKQDVQKAMNSICYVNESNTMSNLYSSEISYSSLTSSGQIRLVYPQIRSFVTYESMLYKLYCYDLACDYVDDYSGLIYHGYVATYVLNNIIPTIETIASSCVINNQLDEVHRLVEITNNFELNVTMEAEVGAKVDVVVASASAGISAFMSASAGYGAGTSFQITYDLYSGFIKNNYEYSIQKKTTKYNFITIVYIPRSFTILNRTQYFSTYNRLAYITNAISTTTYSLTES